MRFCGKIGFGIQKETDQDVWTDAIEERTYRGDVTANRWRKDSGEGINDNLNVTNQISIVADSYALRYLQNMRYVEWMSSKWKISSAELNHPRVILTLGGMWHGT